MAENGRIPTLFQVDRFRFFPIHAVHVAHIAQHLPAGEIEQVEGCRNMKLRLLAVKSHRPTDPCTH